MDFNQTIVSPMKTVDKGAISFADFLNQNDDNQEEEKEKEVYFNQPVF